MLQMVSSLKTDILRTFQVWNISNQDIYNSFKAYLYMEGDFQIETMQHIPRNMSSRVLSRTGSKPPLIRSRV